MKPILTAATISILVLASSHLLLADPTELLLKSESFDREPGWIGVRHRLPPKDPPLVVQDFGYSPTNFAGRNNGEIGGRIGRSTTPAYYADRINPRSLRQPLSASGSFSLVAAGKNSDVFFGWFNHERQGWRPVNFLGFRIDVATDEAQVFLDYTTGTYKAGSIKTKYRCKMDSRKHTWRMHYDPRAVDGRGTLTFQLDDEKPATLVLDAGHQWENATCNRFGMFNLQSPGDSMIVFFDDLAYDGKEERFDRDPLWDRQGNRVEFRDREQRGAQSFGHVDSNFAGRNPGEIGGTFWRVEPDSSQFGYYADRVGPFSFRDPLYASGTMAMTRAASDSGVYLGWFDADAGGEPPNGFIGIIIEGPSRIGHYFRLVYRNQDGLGDDAETGPILMPDGKRHSWMLAYDPDANRGDGALRATLDGDVVVLPLKPDHKTKSKMLDRFGFRTMRKGGHYLTLYVDDLKYTVGHQRR